MNPTRLRAAATLAMLALVVGCAPVTPQPDTVNVEFLARVTGKAHATWTDGTNVWSRDIEDTIQTFNTTVPDGNYVALLTVAPVGDNSTVACTVLLDGDTADEVDEWNEQGNNGGIVDCWSQGSAEQPPAHPVTYTMTATSRSGGAVWASSGPDGSHGDDIAQMLKSTGTGTVASAGGQVSMVVVARKPHDIVTCQLADPDNQIVDTGAGFDAGGIAVCRGTID